MKFNIGDILPYFMDEYPATYVILSLFFWLLILPLIIKYAIPKYLFYKRMKYYKIGDLICSKRYKPEEIFNFGIISNITADGYWDGDTFNELIWIDIDVVDWGETRRYNLDLVRQHFDLLARA